MTSTTMTTMEYTTANSTTGDSLYGGVNLTLMTQVLNILILVFLMISMGVAIDLQDFKETFRRPVAFFIGMGSQFVLMPLIGFCLGLAFKLETAAAISVLILACCPGGTLSNLFTFLADGDVCLSVSMTTISTAVAIGMMPLNLFIYTRVWTSETAVIPYVNIVTTLVSILIPAAFGVLFRWWKKELAKWVTRIGVVAALLCVVITFVISILLNPNIFNVGWQLWLCAGILPMLGYAIGYGFALVFRQSHVKCRTIAFETGSQNVSLALTLTVLTFAESPLFLDMLFYPSLYAVFIYSESFVVLVVYRLVKHLRKRGEDDAEEIVKDTEATKMDVIDSAPKNMARDSNMGCSQDVEIESEYAPRTDINSQPDKQ